MRIARAFLSIIMGSAFAAQTLAAQIYPRDVQRPRPVNPRANPGANAMNSASAESCKALIAWISILEREYPQVDFRLTPADKLYPKVSNLFRDEYFTPFFGKSLAQTTFQDIRNYHLSVFRWCGPAQLTPQEQVTFRRLRTLVERPFLFDAGAYSYQQVVAGAAERQILVRWKDAAIPQIQALPVTPEGFETLETFSKKGKTDLEKLWPSEQQSFLQIVDVRRRTMQPLLAEKLVQSAELIPLGPEGAKDIRYLRAKYERHLQDLEPAANARMNARLDELTSAALDQVLKGHKAKLAAMPSGIDGALAVIAWQRDFAIEVAGINPTPGMQALQAEATSRRRECLTKGMAEFKALVVQYPKTGRNGRNAEDLMAQLFPPESPQLAEFSQYRTVLTARTDQIAAEEQAKEARVQKAKPPPRAQAANQTAAAADPPEQSCDALAGHPGDPGLKGDGVTDAALVAAEAIKQCTLAVREEPKNGRFHFQLGRAYWIGKQYERAVASLLSAEELKYAPAYHYLGLAYEQGRIKGEPADKVLAADLRKMAVAGGFDADAVKVDAVAAVVAEAGPPSTVVEKAEDLDASVFKEPTWVRALFSGDLDALNRSRASVLTYARGMLDFMSLDPNEYDASCLKLVDPSFSGKLDFELAGFVDGKVDMGAVLSQLKQAMSNPGMLIANAQRNEKTSQSGVDDMSVLSEDYGSCAGPVVQRVYKNLNRFVREKPQPKQFAPVGNSRDRAPQPEDVQGVTDPALLARLHQELQDAAAKGFLVTECTYGGGGQKIVSAHWKNSVPPLSDSLRAATPGIVPVALAHCGKQEGYPGAFRNVFRPPPPLAKLTESAPRLSELPRPVQPRMLAPSVQAYFQEVAAYITPLVACKSQFDGMPTYFWRNSLPTVRGAVNWDYLQFVYKYWHVLPAAVNACPPSASAVNASLAFKDY